MKQLDEVTAVGEADAMPEDEAAILKPKVLPSAPGAVPPPPAGALPPMQPAPAAITPPPPIPTLSGDWQAPVASATSAPPIASAAGGTMTPQGDLGNTMRGYETDVGGVFGQADTGDRSQALRALESISGLDSGTTYTNGVYGGGDPTKFGLGANATSADITALSKQNGLIANGDPGAIKAGLTSPNPWLRANAEREAATHPELLQAGAVSRLAGNATAAKPGEQAAGLAAQGLPPIAPAPAAGFTATPGKVANVIPPPAGAPAPASAPSVGGVVATPQKVANVPTQPMGAGAGALPGISAAPSGAFTTKPTDPNNALTDQTLDYGPLTDRFKVAQSELENVNRTEDPQFQADLRDAMRKAAAGGALGSGMLQTSLGDIVANRDVRRSGRGTSFLNNALTGSIQDAKDRANFAAGQQGFQADQQRTAFGQGVTEAELNERLTGGAFQRALQSLIAGSNGNPADIQLALSQIFGNQGANASNALSSLISGKTANSGASSGGYLADLLKQILGGGGAATVPEDTYPSDMFDKGG